MKKNKATILLSAVCCCIAIVFFLSKSLNSTLDIKSKHFALNKGQDFTHIELQGKAGETFTLEYTDKNSWTIDNQFDVNTSLIDNTIHILKNIVMVGPIANSQTERAKLDFQQKGKTITLKNKNKVIYQLRFLASDGKVLAFTKKNRPYYIELMGDKNANINRLIPFEGKKWRTLEYVFPTMDKTSLIELIYPDSTKNGFSIVFSGSKANLSGNDSLKKPVNQEALNDYLQMFPSRLKFELWIKSGDFVMGQEFFRLRFSSASENKTLSGFRLNSITTKTPNPYKFAVITETSDTLLFSYSGFDPILVDKKDFFQENRVANIHGQRF